MYKQGICVVGCGFGDEGKGSIVDALCRKTGAELVVRFNGGCQAAHNVVTPDGKHHTFSQFGSGTLVGAKTYLSNQVIVDPSAFLNEAEHLQSLGIKEPINMVIFNDRCAITTPLHKSMNRLKELARGENRHGSCGMGIGEVANAKDVGHTILTIRECFGDEYRIMSTLESIQRNFDSEIGFLGITSNNKEFKAELKRFQNIDLPSWANFYRDFVSRGIRTVRNIYDMELPTTIIYEGAQGILLDNNHGFGNYRGWGNNTSYYAKALHADIVNYSSHCASFSNIGVFRSYATRHGAGPFPTESKELTDKLCEPHNKSNRWQGDFRCGEFDMALAKYAISKDSFGGLAITHLDRYVPSEVVDYTLNKTLSPTDITKTAVSGGEFFELFGKPILIKSYGAAHTEKQFLPSKIWKQ